MSDNKVIALHGHATPEETETDIISILEEALTQARAGELSNCALAYTKKNNRYYTVWAGNDFLHMLGAIATLQHDMFHEAAEPHV